MSYPAAAKTSPIPTVIPSEAEGSGFSIRPDSSTSPGSRPGSGRNDDGGDDRLSAAKKYADKLNESRLWKIKISYQKRWTAYRRTQKSMQIQYSKPWVHSTGPLYSLLDRLVHHALREQTLFLRLLERHRYGAIPFSPALYAQEARATVWLVVVTTLLERQSVTSRNKG